MPMLDRRRRRWRWWREKLPIIRHDFVSLI